MARLFILCGLPFASKTTLAKALQERLGFARVDMDEINTRIGLSGRASAKLWKVYCTGNQ